MASFNKVIILGNLTRDIELKAAGSTQVGNFTLATNRKFKTASGEQREEVAFIDCQSWGKTAEVMAQYLSKGSSVLVEGRLKLDQWEDRNGGGKRSKLSVVVESFTFVGGGQQGGQEQQSLGGAGSGPAIDHNDIPFSPRVDWA
ncbi:MAG: single-stranded DNA-binding protein [Pseudomonadales bacterium]|nr:single-stranded DNA-binding protein [Pseudomonadales bacterium]